jgi:ATPase subunit of ABC transporter with duplicated ATPase domains
VHKREREPEQALAVRDQHHRDDEDRERVEEQREQRAGERERTLARPVEDGVTEPVRLLVEGWKRLVALAQALVRAPYLALPIGVLGSAVAE